MLFLSCSSRKERQTVIIPPCERMPFIYMENTSQIWLSGIAVVTPYMGGQPAEEPVPFQIEEYPLEDMFQVEQAITTLV